MKKNKSRSKDRRDFNNLVEEELEYSSLMRESENYIPILLQPD